MASPSPSPEPSSSAAPGQQEKASAEKASQPSTSEAEPATDSRDPTPTEGEAEAPPAAADAASLATTSVVPTNGDWQAIFSPQHNAYYFFNTTTQQTTWENPIQPTPEPEASSSPAFSAAAKQPSKYDAALAAGIDPSLAYLDPTLGAGPSGVGGSYAAAARFNARTGRFTADDARDPSHMSEYERAKRMSAFYFDVDGWQKQREQEQQEEEAEGKKRKRPSKKDLERFKEQKKQKKIAKTAWLRT